MQLAAVRGALQWLRGLLSEEFFDACAAHPGERKNDKNLFLFFKPPNRSQLLHVDRGNEWNW